MKAFIISLSKIESSIYHATNMVQPLKDCGFDVTLFEGTYGNDAVSIFKEENRVMHLSRPIGKMREPTPGIMGCFYSHYRLWQKCIELNEPIFIFEDDCVFVRDYHDVEWDDVLIIIQGSWYKMHRVDLSEEPTISPTALDYSSVCMPGAAGYAIKPHAAKKLLEVYNNTYLPTDVAIHSGIVKIQLHSHIIGRALLKKEGKISMTESDWKFL